MPVRRTTCFRWANSDLGTWLREARVAPRLFSPSYAPAGRHTIGSEVDVELDGITIWVADVPATAEFYEAAFGLGACSLGRRHLQG